MSERVLFVDDEPNVLEAIRRQLRKRFDVETASHGEQALQILQQNGPFAVVVSDMRMPGMNGAELLSRAREVAPDTVRMILTGHAEIESAITAINDGHIFRFLCKPCSTETLIRGIEAGVRQYRLVLAERELLERTLSGTVRVLTEVLNLTNPVASGRSLRIQRYVDAVLEHLAIEDGWEFRLAAMLCLIGCVTLPSSTFAKLESGEELTVEEAQLYRSHPELAAKLLSNIPRLEGVAQMVAKQTEAQDLSSLPPDPRAWDRQTLGAVVLRTILEFDRLVSRGADRNAAIAELKRRPAEFPEILLEALRTVQVPTDYTERKALTVEELMPLMVLDEDVVSKTGLRLLPKGQTLTYNMLLRLRTFASGVGIVEPIHVLAPRKAAP